MTLSRLNGIKLHGLLLHRSSELVGSKGPAPWKAVTAEKEAGRVANIGISIYGPGDLAALPEYVRLNLGQCPFNIFDGRIVSSGWLERLRGDGVEAHARSVFLQGLLLMYRTARRAYSILLAALTHGLAA